MEEVFFFPLKGNRFGPGTRIEIKRRSGPSDGQRYPWLTVYLEFFEQSSHLCRRGKGVSFSKSVCSFVRPSICWSVRKKKKVPVFFHNGIFSDADYESSVMGVSNWKTNV